MDAGSLPNCPFSNEFPDTSGGAIFHSGLLLLSNTSFVANEVGIEGPAIMSIGFLEGLSYVNFSENTFYCRVGEYGYTDKHQVSNLFVHHEHIHATSG